MTLRAEFPIDDESVSNIHDLDFFFRDPVGVARSLLGRDLKTTLGGVETAGRIVEVEAYRGRDDPASHAYRGETPRNTHMFLDGGHVYVYFIYGVHYCVNIVAEKSGVGSGVLIRALQPLIGMEAMRRRRKVENDRNLTNGPGRLCQALGIDRSFSGEHCLRSERIRLEDGVLVPSDQVVCGPRIGISKAIELPWRFWIRGNRFVSR